MPTITLISDRRMNDFLIGKLKGRILSECNQVNIIDLAHGLEVHDMNKASFILKNSYAEFPENTVHILSVNNDSRQDADLLVMHCEGQYFIASDNGLLYPIFAQVQEERTSEVLLYRVERQSVEKEILKPPILFILGQLSCRIIRGEALGEIGKKTDDLQKLLLPSPVCTENSIIGSALYIDSFGNLVTNISYNLFLRKAKGKKRIEIPVGVNAVLTKIHRRYSDVTIGEILALFNSMGLLELAQNKGDISRLFDFREDSRIRIDFFD